VVEDDDARSAGDFLDQRLDFGIVDALQLVEIEEVADPVLFSTKSKPVTSRSNSSRTAGRCGSSSAALRGPPKRVAGCCWAEGLVTGLTPVSTV